MVNTLTAMTVAADAVVRRLYARGTWKLHSAAHFGGDETGVADMCLLQDADRRPFIPAASIVGVARSFLARQSLAWEDYIKEENEPQEIKQFFGGAGKDDTMSALTVADAACRQKTVKTIIRDGVRVNARSGSAAVGAKFDVEVVERGAEFELCLECIIRQGENDAELEKLFLALLYGFQQGDIRLGARTRRGYGRGKVAAWDIRKLCMNNPEDVMAWLRDDAWSRPESCLKPHPLPDRRRYFHIEVEFELRTSLLIRNSSGKPKDPEMVHLQSNGQPVVPGTSFAGAFRHRAALIANTIGWRKKHEDKDAVCEMFGPIHEQQSTSRQKDVWASRVRIEERLVEHVESRRQHRVAIDRFTGGSLPSALFDEEPIFPKKPERHIRLTLTLEEPDDAEIGLLLLTLRDFWHGHAALGGETSNGRGTLKGIKAYLRLIDPERGLPKPEWELRNSGNGGIDVKDKDNALFLECCVKKARDYSNRPVGSRRPV